LSETDPYSEKREKLLEDVENNEQELRQAVDELATIAQNSLGIRGFITQRPILWIGGGFLLGLWLGTRR
jgi:hypothetical protein